jgi:type IV pilus assembly protein PilQ
VKKSMKLLAALLALPVLSLCASNAAAQAPNLDARVNLNVADKPLEDVVSFLRERSGANIVVIDPKVLDEKIDTPISKEKISIELNDVPWRDALEIVAEKVKGVVEQRTGGVLVVTKPRRLELFEYHEQPVELVIGDIAKISGANIVISPLVKGTISVRFNGVPWRDALDVVAKTMGAVVVEEGHGVLRVVDPKTLQDQLITRSYQLRFLRPKSTYKPLIKSEFLQATPQTTQATDVTKTFTVLQALAKALSAAGQLDYIDVQNVIVIRDTSQVHDAIKEMLGRLDVEPTQIFCDVKFVSSDNGDILNLGIDYGDQGPQVSISGGQIPVTVPFTLGSRGWEDGIIANPNGNGPYADPTKNGGNTVFPDTVFGALSFTQFQATLRLLQRDTKAEVMQAPKLMTLDGCEATIFVGETIRYAEAKSEQGQAGGLQLSVAEATGSPVEVGFQMLIRPHVVPGTNRIMMEVIPKETSLSGTGTSTLAPPGFDVFTIGASGLQGSIALPRTRSSTIVTTMMLESGQTAVLGGLTTDSDTDTKTKVPFLGDIPVFGELFKHHSRQRDRRSLIVFLTPSVVHSSADQEILLQQELRRRKVELKDELDDLMTADFQHTSTEAQPK